MTRVDQHWMWLFGLDADEYSCPGVRVVGHGSPFFAGYHGAWIFNHERTWVVTVPPSWREEVRGKITQIAPDRLPTDEGIRRLFGDRVGRVIGPTFQGAAEARDFRLFSGRLARRLGTADRPALERMLGACDPEQAAHSGVTADDDAERYGCFIRGELASVAKGTPLGPFAVSPGVLTQPRFRGQGCGRAAVSAVMEAASAAGRVIVYQTLVSNEASVALALSLGIRDYARHTAIRFTL